MNKRYLVELTREERSALEALVSKGRTAGSRLKRAQALLAADCSSGGPALPDAQIAASLGCSARSLERWRKAAQAKGPLGALERKERARPELRKLDGEVQAHLARLACSEPPEGHARWTLSLLAGRLVALDVRGVGVPRDRASGARKNGLKPWRVSMWRIPPKAGAEFVSRMEAVLDVHKRPYDPRFPVVCMDEMPKQLPANVAEPLPMRPGEPKRQEHEYERRGTASVWVFVEPLGGWRDVRVSERRTKLDWARQVGSLPDSPRYQSAERITLVCDNLNTHDPASLYEAFAPEEARRLARKLEIVHTPKKGSWLNVAEIELSVLDRQCTHPRIGSLQELDRDTKAWCAQRNAQQTKVRWQFTTEHARLKLTSLYPTI